MLTFIFFLFHTVKVIKKEIRSIQVEQIIHSLNLMEKANFILFPLVNLTIMMYCFSTAITEGRQNRRCVINERLNSHQAYFSN